MVNADPPLCLARSSSAIATTRPRGEDANYAGPVTRACSHYAQGLDDEREAEEG